MVTEQIKTDPNLQEVGGWVLGFLNFQHIIKALLGILLLGRLLVYVAWVDVGAPGTRPVDGC